MSQFAFSSWRIQLNRGRLLKVKGINRSVSVVIGSRFTVIFASFKGFISVPTHRVLLTGFE